MTKHIVNLALIISILGLTWYAMSDVEKKPEPPRSVPQSPTAIYADSAYESTRELLSDSAFAVRRGNGLVDTIEIAPLRTDTTIGYIINENR